MAGNVQAERLIVEGGFDGNIETEHLVIARSAQVVSDDVMVHDSVVIEPEAHFEGILRRYFVHPNLSPEPRDCRLYAKVRE